MTSLTSRLMLVRFLVVPIVLYIVCFFVMRFNDQVFNLIIFIGGPLLMIIVGFSGRIILDINPTLKHTEKVVHIVHFLFIIIISSAIAKAIQIGYWKGWIIPYWRGWIIPIPPIIGQVLTFVTGFLMLLSIVNLAVSGHGAPGSILKFTEKLAMKRMYAWTRNPMVFSGLLCLISVGLWLRSMLFILWVIVLIIPCFITLLKVFEERELEIRFGSSYLEYKAKTPMFLPKKPKS